MSMLTTRQHLQRNASVALLYEHAVKNEGELLTRKESL